MLLLRYGYNLLLLACTQKPDAGTLAIIRVLLEVGADPNTIDIWGHSPLHHVVHWMKETTESDASSIANLLLKHGALPHQRNYSNETPLDLWTKQNWKLGRTLYPPTWTLTAVMPLTWWNVRSIRLHKTPYNKLPDLLIRKYFTSER